MRLGGGVNTEYCSIHPSSNDSLYYELCNEYDIRSKFKSLKRIGDCFAPVTISSAIYDGRKYAMEIEMNFLKIIYLKETQI